MPPGRSGDVWVGGRLDGGPDDGGSGAGAVAVGDGGSGTVAVEVGPGDDGPADDGSGPPSKLMLAPVAGIDALGLPETVRAQPARATSTTPADSSRAAIPPTFMTASLRRGIVLARST
ncbi:MAG: hypothetical protein ACR2FF_04780 [Mycobacteriales bacterium]|nr:MAG: hypothetical protein DLM56_04180 [Pseudonocardiales bacterium]